MSTSASMYVPRTKRISLTALIDVVFILLMFFMLTSNFQRWTALEINANTAGSTADSRQLESRFLKVSAAGNLVWLNSGISMNLSELRASYFTAREKALPCIIVPESNVTLQDLVTLLETLESMGFTQLSLGDVVARHD